MRTKPILIGVGVTLTTLVGIVAFAISRIDPIDYLPMAAAKVKEQTGRELKVDGKIGFTWSLIPTISVEGVRFQNAPWGSRADMLLARRIDVEIALLPLLGGKVDIRGLSLVEPDVLLETNAKGEGNWQFSTTQPDQPVSLAEGAKSQSIDIRRAQIDQGVLVYKHLNDKKGKRLDIVHLGMKSSGTRMNLDLNARLNNEALEAKVGIEREASPSKADLTIKATGFNVAANIALLDGTNTDAAPNGHFNIEVSNWNTVAKLAGIEPIKLPHLKATGNLKSARNAWIADELKATLGKSNFSGTVKMITTKADPSIDIKLQSTLVDLAELQGPPKKETPRDGHVFSADPLPIQALRDLNGRIDARIDRLALKDGKAVDGVEFQAVADHGRIQADPVRLKIEGRELRVRANLDATSGKALGVDLGIDGTGISLGALGALLNLSGTPEGSPTDISIRFAGHGDSVRALMAGANSDVRLVIGAGKLRNRAIDWGADVTELLNAINPARASEPYTELKCAVVRLPIRQGVARIENSIAAETAKVNVIAAGVIDLRNETLDLGFRPKAATGLGIGLGGLASLGRLRGSLATPKVELDMGGTAKAAAQLGLAAATGGLSLLAGGLLSADVPDRPCQAALTGAVRSPSTSAQEKPGVVDSVVGGIKKLFGR